MKLYSYWRSSSAWRVRIALAWKELDCEIVPIHLLRAGGEQHLPAFLARNPLAQVPVLQVDHAATERQPGGAPPLLISQSMAILEYLEERYPTPPLLPALPEARALVRQLAQVVISGIQPLQNLKLQQALRGRGVEPAPFLGAFVAEGLKALEEYGRTTAGRFLVGDSPTFADITLVPQLHASRRLGIDVERGPFPILRRVEARCASLPAFQRAHPDVQPDAESTAPP